MIRPIIQGISSPPPGERTTDDFLTVEQARRYGHYQGPPGQEQLEKYFHLDGRDLSLLGRLRGDHNRLGFAVQLTTARFLGTFQPDPLEVPEGVLRYLQAQLNTVPEDGDLERYRHGETRWGHQRLIRREYGYKEFSVRVEQLGLLRYLYARSWVNDDGSSLLFDAATARLVERKVLLPGATVLARLVSRVRERGRGPARGPHAGIHLVQAGRGSGPGPVTRPGV